MDYFESRIIRVLINPIEIFAVFRTILFTLSKIIDTSAILGREFYLENKNIYTLGQLNKLLSYHISKTKVILS